MSLKSTEKYFLDDPELQDSIATNYLSHSEVYEEAIRKATVTLRKLKELQVQGRGGNDLYEWVNLKKVLSYLGCYKILFGVTWDKNKCLMI